MRNAPIELPRIVITGAGLACSLGLDCDAVWRQVSAGRCGMGRLTALESDGGIPRDGGQAPELQDSLYPGLPREVRYLKCALAEAMEQAGVASSSPYLPRRCGFVLGTTLHGMRQGGVFLRNGDWEQLSSFTAGATLALAAHGTGLEGFCTTTCSACASGLSSIALGVTLLRSGHCDLVVTGGYDPISEYAYGGFMSLRLVADGPLKPFCVSREGMKLAEGYGVVVLERDEDASARNAAPLAVVAGFGESSDSHHLSQPHPEGAGAAVAMRQAIESAGLSPDQIDMIATHSTATPANDAAERLAMKLVYGNELPGIPLVGFKSHLGHTLGGAGAVEVILSLMSLRHGAVPPCANVDQGDVEYSDLDLVTGVGRRTRIKASINTSLGFGGSNASIVLCEADQTVGNNRRHIRPAKDRSGSRPTGDLTGRDVFITGLGIVLPGVTGKTEFSRHLDRTPGTPITGDTGSVEDTQLAPLISARRVRRMSPYVKLGLASATLAYQDAGIEESTLFNESCHAILGTTHGSTEYCARYYRQIVEEGIDAANTLLFAEGVPNAAAAHLSMMLSIKGACQSIIGTRTAGLDALILASLRIAGGLWDRAIISAAEEYVPILNEAYRYFGLYSGGAQCSPGNTGCGFATGSGAVTLVLENRESLEERGGNAIGRVEVCSSGTNTSADPARMVKIARQVINQLGTSAALIGSANGTWLDRVESAAMRRCGVTPAVFMDGAMAETFSVGPLAAIAGYLGLSFDKQRGDKSVSVICSDYGGNIRGIRVAAS
jgi:3-oxoacyl-[acyl-carrier-protein] synthase II